MPRESICLKKLICARYLFSGSIYTTTYFQEKVIRMKTSNNLRKTQISGTCFRLLVLLTLLPTMIINAQTMKFPDGWSDAYAYVNGIRVHYYHAKPAQGKPVMVMVHGFTDIGLSWTTLTLKLQDAYDIYMPDDRGH